MAVEAAIPTVRECSPIAFIQVVADNGDGIVGRVRGLAPDGEPNTGARSWHLGLALQQVSGPISGIRQSYIGRFTRDDRAVRTAGVKVGGEGYLGFSQPLFLAGARSLVVSLWPVRDQATALLMARFYGNWLGKRDGIKPMPKAKTLEEAKQWLRNLEEDDVKVAIISRTAVPSQSPRRRRRPTSHGSLNIPTTGPALS